MTLAFEQFKWVADTLGLRIEPQKAARLSNAVTLDGAVEGVPVHVEQWTGQFVHVYFSALLAPPADLRLSIAPAGLGAKLGALLGRHDIQVGDKTLDDAFEIKADEPERARALFTPALRAALLAWKDAGVQFFSITDERVFFAVMPGVYSSMDGPQIAANIRAIASLARAVDLSLASVPSSGLLAPSVDAWGAYAAAHELSFSPSPLRVWGRLGNDSFVARAVAIEDWGYGIELKLRFEKRLPWLLRVRPAHFHDFLERTGDAHHQKTGDADFDGVLRVTTTDTAATAALLDAEVRAALLGLHRDEGDLLLDADGLSIRTRSMMEPEGFARLLAEVSVVERRLRGAV